MARLNMYLDGELVDSIHYRMSIKNFKEYQNQLTEALNAKHRNIICNSVHLPVFMIEGVESSLGSKENRIKKDQFESPNVKTVFIALKKCKDSFHVRRTGYHCPKCKKGGITIQQSFCPSCGIPIEFNRNVRQPIHKK